MGSLNTLLAVAFGGAVGAVARYFAVSVLGLWLGAAFPYGTLTVNVLGSFVLGAIVELSALVWSPSPELRAMLVVGVLGSFTTFSTFSLDAVTLYERGDYALCGVYIGASVVLSLFGFFAGMHAIRWGIA